MSGITGDTNIEEKGDKLETGLRKDLPIEVSSLWLYKPLRGKQREWIDK